MNLFEKEFKDSYIKYHTNPIPENYLDPRVFYVPAGQTDPILQDEVAQQIFRDIDTINTSDSMYNKTRVKDYIVVGPILEKNSSDKCDIKVVVQIDTTNLDDMLKERLLNTIKGINDRLAPGTVHPLIYIPTIRDFDEEAYTAIYHPYTQKWLKKPRYLGESKHSLEKLGKDPAKFKKKHSSKIGIRKLTTL